uniref:caspase-3-like n=1 Tax=Styela clava TaxID=7725 RepID=UPI0019394BCD|nr:caspase-3-like [Styela clava]
MSFSSNMGKYNSKMDPPEGRYPPHTKEYQAHPTSSSAKYKTNGKHMRPNNHNGGEWGSVESNDYEHIQGHGYCPEESRHEKPSRPHYQEKEENDPFKDMQFDDEELRKEELRHQQNLKALDQDYERRMRALETVRKRKMEETLDEYNTHPNFTKNRSAFADSYNFSGFKNRGLCMIVQNSDRYEKSAEILKGIFTQLGYEVNMQKNLNEMKMLNLLQYASYQDFGDYGSFVSFILGKGTDKYVETVDKKPVEIRTIVDFFKPTEVPSLAGKPKLFFIQNDIDILKDKGLWKESQHDKPVVDYMDAFVVRSTHRDFMKNFTTIIKQDSRMPLTRIIDTVSRHTMPLASNKEKYEVVSTLLKEVYFGQNESSL